ncbi:Glutathione-regulated potassium-efflux system protein KefB [Coccomyxa sp. Obi]|nr:Glutathione-regulated potassium-efflux system protein KefB [Coccomyxa sp. Obi]
MQISSGDVTYFVRHQPLRLPWSNCPCTRSRKESWVTNAVPDPLLPLGLDFLTFLAATVLVIPVFKSVKASPVLGFLFSGLVLGQLGLFRNTEELEKLSELGVLFLLFEMGLELSLDRLKALAKYAFGLGSLTMFASTVVFTLMSLPPGKGIGTQILVKVFHASPKLAAVGSVDEAVVIGAALSLSSSAFVLQLLSERGELATRFGSATLGILLLQDIAVVPFLVLLPLVENDDLMGQAGQSTMTLVTSLGPTALQTVFGLGVLLLGGRVVLRRIFELVAEARSDETFVALCLLTVTGASLLTQKLGFSDTMGAFVAGVLLAETNYSTQVEADIRPFRGMLLGLFFVTTGASMDVSLLLHEWNIVLSLLVGLIAVKIGIIGSMAPFFGLNRQESIRTAFLLSQGGEFAFVLLSLANELKVLPTDLNRLLIIVVVLSMALTPFLAEAGKRFAESTAPEEGSSGAVYSGEASEGGEDAGVPDSRAVVICGFGELGQTLASMLESPLGMSLERGRVPYVAFDLQPSRLRRAREAGFNVLYGDASRPAVLEAAGIAEPRAIAVVYTARARSVAAVRSLREGFADVAIYVRALDSLHAAELKAAGASTVITANTEVATEMGSQLLFGLGANANGVRVLVNELRKQVDARVGELADDLAAEPQHASGDPDALVFRVDQKLLPPAEDSRNSYLQPPTDVVLQRERMRESFRKDSDVVGMLNGSMEDTTGLSDSEQRSNSEFSASASSNGAPSSSAQPEVLHEATAAHADADADHKATSNSHSPDNSHIDMGGSIDDVGATIR